MFIAMTCTFTDTPVVLEVAGTIPDMIIQLAAWVTTGVLDENVQTQVRTACEQEDPTVVDDSFDGLAPITLEPEGLVIYIQHVAGV